MTVADILETAALAVALTTAMLVPRAREGMPGADEGYVWYGALRTLAGDIPLRDFRSYEPGRYYWCAFWLRLLGRGVVSVRVASHAFYALGLTCGLAALRLGGLGWWATAAAGIVLAAWGHEQYKLFEPALALIAVSAGVLLLAEPGYTAVAVAGAVVGATSFFAVNYALYAGVALLVLTLLEAVKSGAIGLVSGLGVYGGGVALGSLPLLVMLALVPGLLGAFFERRVKAPLARGTTNLPLPVPWPWRHAPPALDRFGFAGRRFMSTYFLLLPAFAWPVVVWAAIVSWSRLEAHAVVVASAAVGAANLHHAFSRADLEHLAQSVAPFVVEVVALLGHGYGWLVVALLLGVGTCVTVLAVHPRVERHRHRDAYVLYESKGMRLWTHRWRADMLDGVSSVVQRLLEPDEPLLAVPNVAELFPILGRRSVVYDTYCVYPAREREQQAMLDSLDAAHVRLAVVVDHPLDGREERRFSRTHPLVWFYLDAEFERLDVAGVPPNVYVLHRDARRLSGSPRPRPTWPARRGAGSSPATGPSPT